VASTPTGTVEFAVLGWPPDGPTLDLDHERFAYAGKFVRSTTGTAVARDDGAVVGAVSFDADRTDETTLRLRYVTVRADRRGERIGPRLASLVAARRRERGFERARIAVNNPFAYEALYRAGFVDTGEETGLAERVLERPGERDPARYRAGLAAFADRDLSPAETAFVAERRDGDPPARLPDPALGPDGEVETPGSTTGDDG
jgi:GNAT superfamily N-acetyltransferase